MKLSNPSQSKAVSLNKLKCPLFSSHRSWSFKNPCVENNSVSKRSSHSVRSREGACMYQTQRDHISISEQVCVGIHHVICFTVPIPARSRVGDWYYTFIAKAFSPDLASSLSSCGHSTGERGVSKTWERGKGRKKEEERGVSAEKQPTNSRQAPGQFFSTLLATLRASEPNSRSSNNSFAWK